MGGYSTDVCGIMTKVMTMEIKVVRLWKFLEIKSIGFPDRLCAKCETKRTAKDKFLTLGLTN